MLWTSSGQTYGARKVRTWIETDMRAQLVQMKLEKKIVENCTVHIDAVAGKDEPDYKVVERSGVLRWKSVKGMMQAVLRSKDGPARQQQPIGFFLVLGLPSERKTALGKALAKELFDDENLLVRINMSERMDKHLVASPIDGAPPGQVETQNSALFQCVSFAL